MATSSPSYTDDASRKDEEDEEKYLEFSAEQDLSPEEQSKIVDKLDKMFRYALDHPSWIEGRQRMVQCFKYVEGEQWTAAEKAELEERGQPDTVNNQLSVVVNKLVGDLVNQRFRVGFRGRNAPADEEMAQLLSDIFLYIRQSNDLEFEERDMAEDGFVSGMGVLEVDVEFDDMLQPEIKVRHEDPLTTFPDPDSRRYDWNEDASFVARAKWWKVDDAAEMYPQAAASLKSMVGSTVSMGDGGSGQLAVVDAFKGEQYVDAENERVRVIEVQYKKKERQTVLLMGDGRSLPFTEKKEIIPTMKQAEAAGLRYKIIDRLHTRICVGVYAAGVLLEHKETDHKYFSLVPYFAYRRKTGEPYSLITLALSMQDAINKRESKALHLLTVNQVIAEKTAVDDPAKTKQEVAKPDGYVEVRDGALTQQRFQIEKNLELAASQYQMHQRAQEDLYKIVGVDSRMGQTTGELRSGAGLQRKYLEASKPVAKLFDNIRRTRKIFGRVVLDRIQKYFTPDKTFLITDDQNKSHMVGLSSDALERIKTGMYDTVVEEFDDDPTTQDEQFRVFAETLPQILQFPPQYAEMLIRMSRIRDKEEVLKILSSQQGPPPLQPKMNLQANLDAMSVVERAGVWDLVGRKDISQALLQNPPMPSHELKAQTELAKEQMKQGEDNPDIAQQKAAMEMQQSQQEHAQKMEQSSAQHNMKMTEMAMKHDVDLKKTQMDMQKLVLQAAMPKKEGKKDTKSA